MIRRYQTGDELRIGQIFCAAIHQLASADYTSEQLHAWAGRHADPDSWRQRCEIKRPFVYVLQGRIVGFIELDPDGHIDCTYVDPAHAGRGVMSEIMLEVKRTARELQLPRLFAEVSKTARRFFERHGFVWIKDNLVNIEGITLRNYIMVCDLEGSGGRRSC